mmetsp:Transcript_11672/g.33608  ORF Transcript_11672/g.33608 Transcript_11672/m.33608 type:complete len:268 (-) Transcript_11672:1363-2166(-)
MFVADALLLLLLIKILRAFQSLLDLSEVLVVGILQLLLVDGIFNRCVGLCAVQNVADHLAVIIKQNSRVLFRRAAVDADLLRLSRLADLVDVVCNIIFVVVVNVNVTHSRRMLRLDHQQVIVVTIFVAAAIGLRFPLLLLLLQSDCFRIQLANLLGEFLRLDLILQFLKFSVDVLLLAQPFAGRDGIQEPQIRHGRQSKRRRVLGQAQILDAEIALVGQQRLRSHVARECLFGQSVEFHVLGNKRRRPLRHDDSLRGVDRLLFDWQL